MPEEQLLYHVISRLESQILDYVEVRHPQTTCNLLEIIDKYDERFLNRKIRNPGIQTKVRAIVSLTGIGREIGGRQEVTADTLTIADHRGNSKELKVGVFRITGGSIVNAEVVSLIIDSITKTVDRMVRGRVLSGVRMIKTGI
ncbi:hypothetical protein TNCV_4651791 [Trichonephila clavipes]|nr:hypothetical protein TNCV_4651791 [Trichonephila clavipes]